MVDLPQVPRRLALVEAPQTRFQPPSVDAAAPYKILANTLDQVGDSLEQVAISAAERAGQQDGENSVRKDENGNLVVDRTPLPIIGKAGAAYSRAARMSALSKLEPEIETKATELRLQFPGDPDSFKNGWKGFSEKTLENHPDPVMRGAVSKVLNREGGQGYRSALVTADKLNTDNALVAYKSRLNELENKGAALARQGGVGTPEYMEVQQGIQTLYNELGTDPRFKYPADRIASEMEAVTSRHRSEAVIGKAMSLYDKATPTSAAEARKFLTEAAWDPALNLKTEERVKIVTRGMAALDGRTAENKALIDGNKKIVGETIEALKSSAPYDVRRFNDMLQQSAQLGDVESYYKLSTYQVFHEWRRTLAPLPVPEQVDALRAMRSSAGLVDRIIGVESGGNPGARATTSSAAGLGQFVRGTWLDMVRRNRPDLATGKSDTELLALRTDASPAGRDLQREMVSAYAEQNRQQLSSAGVRSDNAALYLAHFLGPADAVKVLKAAPGTTVEAVVTPASIAANASVFGKNPTAGALVAWSERKMGSLPGGGDVSRLPAAGQSWARAVQQEAVNDVSKQLGGRAEGMVVTLEQAVGKGRTPSDQEITDLASLLHETGRTDLIDRVDTVLAAHEGAQALTKAPVAVRQAFRAQIAATAAQGGDPKTRRVIDATEDAVRATSDGMDKKPYSTGAARGLHGAPAPLIFEDGAALAAVVDQRSQMDRVHRSLDGTPARSIFEGAETDAFKTAMVRGDAKVVAGTFGALGRLDDEQLFVTLSDGSVRDSVQGAIRTTDPAKYTAVMSSLDALYARAPESFVKLMGTDAWHDLKTWQSTTRYLDEKTIAEQRTKALDPQVAQQRKRNEDEGRKIAGKKDVDEVVKEFDDAWFSGLRGVRPAAPVDSGTRDALMGDYQTIYARRYAETLNEDEAKKQTLELLKTKWARSDINGGRLMLRAPETLYPAVNGSHDWMKQQVETDLAARLGPRTSQIAGPLSEEELRTGMKPAASWEYALVPDRATETDAQSGRPASYQIVVKNNLLTTPKWDVVRQEDGKEMRYRFDPGPTVGKARTDFERERARMTAPPISISGEPRGMFAGRRF